MPRYIDADALIADFESVGGEFDVDGIKYIINTYHKPADVVPVVRGEWEVAIGYDPNKKVQCQNCYKMAYEPTPHCPNCGAKMDGERRESEVTP